MAGSGGRSGVPERSGQGGELPVGRHGGLFGEDRRKERVLSPLEVWAGGLGGWPPRTGERRPGPSGVRSPRKAEGAGTPCEGSAEGVAFEVESWRCGHVRARAPLLRAGLGHTHTLPPRRPLLAGRAGAGPELLQPPATQHVQAGQRQGTRVFTRRVALLALRAAPLGHLPPPGPVPVSELGR